ncbi:unnamed protein product, partial [Symbiodinium microadriaticum]
ATRRATALDDFLGYLAVAVRRPGHGTGAGRGHAGSFGRPRRGVTLASLGGHTASLPSPAAAGTGLGGGLEHPTAVAPRLGQDPTRGAPGGQDHGRRPRRADDGMDVPTLGGGQGYLFHAGQAGAPTGQRGLCEAASRDGQGRRAHRNTAAGAHRRGVPGGVLRHRPDRRAREHQDPTGRRLASLRPQLDGGGGR